MMLDLRWLDLCRLSAGEDEKRMVEILSAQMSAINALYLENVPSTEEIEDKTKQMRETPNLVISLSSIMKKVTTASASLEADTPATSTSAQNEINLH
jgi:hypothetical protein